MVYYTTYAKNALQKKCNSRKKDVFWVVFVDFLDKSTCILRILYS